MKTVLVVDDDDSVRKTVCALIKDAHPDAVVVSATNGSQAWEVVNALGKKLDLAISDTRMPIMDGVELTRRIREAHPDTRVILMSGEKETENHVADKFLAKPFGKTLLLEAIKKAMAKPS